MDGIYTRIRCVERTYGTRRHKALLKSVGDRSTAEPATRSHLSRVTSESLSSVSAYGAVMVPAPYARSSAIPAQLNFPCLSWKGDKYWARHAGLCRPSTAVGLPGLDIVRHIAACASGMMANGAGGAGVWLRGRQQGEEGFRGGAQGSGEVRLNYLSSTRASPSRSKRPRTSLTTTRTPPSPSR
jgi:hypothetical protein